MQLLPEPDSYTLIVIFGPVSGAHFNPVVSAVSVWERRLPRAQGAVYVLAQFGGAFVGVAAAHTMFGLPVVQISARLRPTLGEGLGEVIATFGLVLVILLALRFKAEAIPVAVAAFITSAYWFTSSTSFANPAVTVARAMTDTFAGISPRSAPLFILSQAIGGTAAALFARWLLGAKVPESPEPHWDPLKHYSNFFRGYNQPPNWIRPSRGSSRIFYHGRRLAPDYPCSEE